MTDPKEIVKKLALLQIGAIAVISEKVESLIEELEEKGKLTEKEGREFLNKLKNAVKEQKEDIAKEVAKIVKSMNLATREEVEELRREVEELRKRLEEKGSG